MRHILRFGGCGLALCVFAGTASGVIHTLSDRNSLVQIDDASQAGMFDWFVDGTDHMFQQWFWFRVGMSPEVSIDTLALTGTFIGDTNPFDDPASDTLSLRYSAPGFDIQPTWVLRGTTPGSARSDVTESITITNHENFDLSISFFQYSDFDLNGTSGGDTAVIPGLLHNTALQSEAGFTLSETVVAPVPSHYEVANFPSILTRLNDGLPDTLTDFAGPVFGDCTWAFQWDFVIPAGQSVVISKDKAITPAPGALALLGIGMLTLARRRR
ncbi:hypothetical protein PHYC_00401 [Phycisphaerales bacterium]|nr:hypothetical protein PHYC_00401 [Phycisphaerales bacterium]